MKKFKVMYGHTKKGKKKIAYFDSLEKAIKAVSEVFEKTGIVLAIESV